MLGSKKKANFENWIIDSHDLDPVYGSLENRKYIYVPRYGGSYLSTTDRVGPIRERQIVDFNFKTCIFDCKEVPENGKSISAQALMRRKIKCIDWNVNHPE